MDQTVFAALSFLGMLCGGGMYNHLRFIYEVLDVNNLNAVLIMVVRAGIVIVPKDEKVQRVWKIAA